MSKQLNGNISKSAPRGFSITVIKGGKRRTFFRVVAAKKWAGKGNVTVVVTI